MLHNILLIHHIPRKILTQLFSKFKILKILHNTENTVFSFENTGGTFKFK